MGLKSKIMARFPSSEVAVRRIYNRVKYSKLMNSKSLKRMVKKSTAADSSKQATGSWEKYCEYINSLGIKNGDILIVHSSTDGLEKFSVDNSEIIGYLKNLVGEDGTLAMPAFPFYRKKNVTELNFDEKSEEPLTYSPKTSLSWTGMLPNYLCTLDGTVRSLFPVDTLAATGKEAEQMMKDNLSAEVSHGKMTAWDYCNARHAKVLFLGVSPLRCLSEIHIYEDMNKDEWPVRGWYKNQKFIIKQGKEKSEFDCKVRKQFWNQYITEYYCMDTLIKNNIMKYDEVENTPVGFIYDTNKMTEFVADSVRKKDLLFWKIPSKYWK